MFRNYQNKNHIYYHFLALKSTTFLLTIYHSNKKALLIRMQQIQLLSTEKKPPNFDRLWDQLESEISLNRQKIIVKACRKQQSMLQVNKLI